MRFIQANDPKPHNPKPIHGWPGDSGKHVSTHKVSRGGLVKTGSFL